MTNVITTGRNTAPPILDAVQFDLQLSSYKKIQLQNGIELYYVNAGAEDVMNAEWVFFAGNSFESKNLVAAASNFLIRNGTSNRNAFQINEHFEYYGSYLNRSCYNETAVVSLHCLTKHIGELLPVVRELITDSVMPDTELDIFRKNSLQRLAVNLKKTDFVAGRLIDSYLFGIQHPYGRYTEASDFQNLQRNELLDFYRNYYQNGKMIIFLAGKLPAQVEQLFDRYFGNLPNREYTVPDFSCTPSNEKKFRVQIDGQGAQGSIRIARPFVSRMHPDYLKSTVLNTVLGGFFGSRLMRNIREDKGYTYGIHSYFQKHIGPSAWMISTDAGSDVCEAAIREVYREMQILREELVPDEELSLVKNFMIGSILSTIDGPFQIMGRWKSYILNNLPERFFYDNIEAIKYVTAEELRVLAQKYLQPDEFYELVVQ